MDCIGFVRWVVSYQLDCIAGSYRIGWIGMDCIVSYHLDQETLAFAHWLITAWMGWMGWMGRMGRMDWMGRWWDGGGTGTGEPLWATEQERHRWLLRVGDALASYCLDGTDGLEGALVGRGWGIRTLAGDGTGAPP